MIDEERMETVTISPKFQVVIPKTIREKLKLRDPNELLQVAISWAHPS